MHADHPLRWPTFARRSTVTTRPSRLFGPTNQSIPKKSGGERILGVPTVSDRIAQMVVKQLIEPDLDPQLSPHFFEGPNATGGWRFAATILA